MSLGFRKGHDHIAERAFGPRSVPALPEDAKTSKATALPSMACKCPIPRGFLPTLVYSSLAAIVPLLWFYMTYDYTDTMVQGGVIALAAVAGLVVVLANDCCCWYNMALFFHAGVEVKVIDTALAFSYSATGADKTWSMVAAITIIVHLVPFLVTDRTLLLSFLAYAGVVVNACTLVYLDSSLLLLVGASSLSLLSSTMVIGGICEIRTSMLSLLQDAIKNRMFITCESFEL